MVTPNLQGRYFVVPTATSIVRAWKLACGRVRDFQRLRRHGLKLAHWPAIDAEQEREVDIDWDWIEGLADKRIGELRIDEVIAGQNNIRIIFFKANKALDQDPILEGDQTMLRIWLLTVFQKKSQGFSSGMLRAWQSAREIIVQRYYSGDSNA